MPLTFITLLTPLCADPPSPSPLSCPGGLLPKCMSLCPSEPPATFAACIKECAFRCTPPNAPPLPPETTTVLATVADSIANSNNYYSNAGQLHKAHSSFANPGCNVTCNLEETAGRFGYSATVSLARIWGNCGCRLSLAPRPWLIDVGASLVQSADAIRWLKTPSLANASVLGLEPNPTNCKELLPVMESFGPRARFGCKFVSNQRGNVTLSNANTLQGARLAKLVGSDEDVNNTLVVPVTKLDDEIPHGERVAFLKTDTQGHELHVLHGARNLLHNGLIDWVHVEFDVFSLRSASTPEVPSSALDLLNLFDHHGFACINSRIRTYSPYQFYMCPPCEFAWNIDECRPGEGYAADKNGTLPEVPCKYTDLICARRVLVTYPVNWKETLLRADFPSKFKFCTQVGWKKNLCTGPHSHLSNAHPGTESPAGGTSATTAW